MTQNNSNNSNNSQMSDNQVHQILYTETQLKSLGKFALAFTIPDDLPPVNVEGFTISWTKEALAHFSQIYSELPTIKNLPYAYLRSLLEFTLSDVCTIEPNMGLRKYATYKRDEEIFPFAYINGGEQQQITKDLMPILNDWLENNLARFATKEGVSEALIDRLRELQSHNQLLSIEPFKSRIYPWLQYKESGTAKPDKFSFPILANHLARLISGHEIFKDLGAIKRIISKSGGSQVELITTPIPLSDKGLFSLVVEIEIITFNSVSQPLIKVDVHKRRWLNSLKENTIDRNSINGYIFSKKHSDRIFNFKLNRRRNSDTGKYEWQTDDAFSVLKRELHLPLNISNANQIIKGEASTDDCQVLLTYRNGIQEKKHDIDVGVPETDKLEALIAITEIFASEGIKYFENYSKVNITHSTKEKEKIEANSKQINKPTLLNAVLEFLENGKISEFTPEYLKNTTNEEINNLLNKHLNFTLSEQGIKLFRFNKKDKDQSQ